MAVAAHEDQRRLGPEHRGPESPRDSQKPGVGLEWESASAAQRLGIECRPRDPPSAALPGAPGLGRLCEPSAGTEDLSDRPPGRPGGGRSPERPGPRAGPPPTPAAGLGARLTPGGRREHAAPRGQRARLDLGNEAGGGGRPWGGARAGAHQGRGGARSARIKGAGRAGGRGTRICAMLRRLLLLLLLLGPRPAAPAERLCGHRLVRELVRVCGAPRWSPEAGGDRELLPWLEGRPLHAPGAAGAPEPGRRRRAAHPAHRCCVLGCDPRDLVGLCPR
ncbi:insulin-like 3 [Thomomys bottae]